MVAWRWRLVAAAFGLSTSSCAGFVLRQDVESARTAWQINPSGQRAVSYAEALHDAFLGQAYVGPDSRLQTTGRTRRCRPSAPSRAAADRSFRRSSRTAVSCFWISGAITKDGRSFNVRWPSRRRRRPRAASFRSGGRGAAATRCGDACARTLPAMHEAASRFQLLDLCVKNMHAATDAAALAWAPPEALAFYRDERARREEAAAWFASQQAHNGHRASPTGSLSWPVRQAAAAAPHEANPERHAAAVKLDRAWQVDGVPVIPAPGGLFHARPASAFRWPCGSDFGVTSGVRLLDPPIQDGRVRPPLEVRRSLFLCLYRSVLSLLFVSALSAAAPFGCKAPAAKRHGRRRFRHGNGGSGVGTGGFGNFAGRAAAPAPARVAKSS